MRITQADDISHIRFMRFGCQRVPQEDNQINLILLDLCADLLLPAQMSGQVLMNIQIGYFFNQTACCAGRIKCVAAQDSAVGDAEILHKLLLRIMCYQQSRIRKKERGNPYVHESLKTDPCTDSCRDDRSCYVL